MADSLNLDTPINYIKGVGDKTAQLFARLKIRTVKDLLEYYPRRYDDYSSLTKIGELQPGEVSIKAKVERISGRYVRRAMHITEAVLNDESGKVKAVWFNQPYLAKSMPKDVELFFSGDYQLSHTNVSLLNPAWEKVSEFQKNTARILPIYKETKGLTSRQIRKVMSECLGLASKLPKHLPEGFMPMDRAEAIRQIHFPSSSDELERAKSALGFEELFVLITAAQLARREHKSFKADSVAYDDKSTKNFLSNVGFQLTDAQKQASWQIIKDIENTGPMNRLLQGDVGSVKTVSSNGCSSGSPAR